MANNMNRCSARFASDACISIYVLADKTMATQHGKMVQCKSWAMFILYFGDISDTRIYCLQKKKEFVQYWYRKAGWLLHVFQHI